MLPNGVDRDIEEARPAEYWRTGGRVASTFAHGAGEGRRIASRMAKVLVVRKGSAAPLLIGGGIVPPRLPRMGAPPLPFRTYSANKLVLCLHSYRSTIAARLNASRWNAFYIVESS